MKQKQRVALRDELLGKRNRLIEFRLEGGVGQLLDLMTCKTGWEENQPLTHPNCILINITIPFFLSNLPPPIFSSESFNW